MNLKLLIRPFFLLTLTFIVYTGCNRKPAKYIYMPPSAILFTNTVPVPESSIVPVDRVNIELRLNTQEIQVAIADYLPRNSAYALKITHPGPIPVEKVEDVHIRPLHLYNNDYRAMEDLSESCSYSYDHMRRDTLSKQHMLDAINSGYMNVGASPFYIHFNEPPSGKHVQQFIVEIITDKNSRLADTTLEFILTP